MNTPPSNRAQYLHQTHHFAQEDREVWWTDAAIHSSSLNLGRFSVSGIRQQFRGEREVNNERIRGVESYLKMKIGQRFTQFCQFQTLLDNLPPYFP